MRPAGWIWIAALALVILAVWNATNALAVAMLVNAPNLRRAPGKPPADVREVFEVQRAGAKIRAWVFDPAGAPRGTVAVLHGIRASKLGELGSARAHVQRGYRALVLDSRGHGESTGRYLSYGVHESRDLVAVLDALERRGLLTRPLYVVGSSYGAATALQYAAIDPRVTKVAALAPFASLREVVRAYLRWQLGWLTELVPAFWIDARIDQAGRVGDFDPDQACPRCVAPQLQAAVLLIARRDDERIPYQQTESIRAAIGPRARFMLVSGVGHVGLGGGPGVAHAVQRFLDEPP
jgi:pimeloyl-ACP methyl ester carboxylesterase